MLIFHCSIDRELDSRIEKNERDDGFKSKQTSPSSSSSVLGPPPDAPDWAVQTVWVLVVYFQDIMIV